MNQRSLTDYVALAIATCGVGYFPIAPGTWGSALGVGLYLLWHYSRVRIVWLLIEFPKVGPVIPSVLTTMTLAMILCITMAGIWAATRVEKLLGRKDPGFVVIDEVAGQLIAFLPIIFINPLVDWPLIVAGFLLFRLFDIWKPYPIRRLESLESGLGIMADDVLAGAYAAAVLSYSPQSIRFTFIPFREEFSIMQETKDTKTGETSGGPGEDARGEATSSKTLSEIEETEKVTDEKSGAGNSSVPSPDGAFDSDQSEHGLKDDPAPM